MSDDEEISVYDEVEIEDMTYDETLQTYHYPCPCGDRFEIALADLLDESNDIAVCPSCSLMIRVIYEVVSLLCQPCSRARNKGGRKMMGQVWRVEVVEHGDMSRTGESNVTGKARAYIYLYIQLLTWCLCGPLLDGETLCVECRANCVFLACATGQPSQD